MPDLSSFFSRKFGAAIAFAVLIWNSSLEALPKAIVCAGLVGVWILAEAWIDSRDFAPTQVQPHNHELQGHRHDLEAHTHDLSHVHEEAASEGI